MIFEKLRDLICNEFDIDAEYVTMDTNLMRDLDFDSLDLAELGMSVEDEFAIELPYDEELDAIRTVADLVRYIEENK